MISTIYWADRYREGFSLPKMEDTPESEKQGVKYNRQVSEWLYSMYSRSKCEIGRDLINKIDELRTYAKGTQDTEKYKSFYGGQKTTSTGTETGEDVNQYTRKGFASIDWSNAVSFIPTLMTAIKGAISDNDYDIKADPIDWDSGIEEDRLMVGAFVDSKFGPLFNQLGSVGGLPPRETTPAMDFDELEQYKKEGIFKEPYIREHEKLLQHTENISGWDNTIRPKLIDDLLTTKYASAHAKYSKSTSKVEWEYVDPKDVVIQYSKNSDFSDTDFAGFLRWKSISELRACSEYISSDDKKGITEDELKGIASTYKNIYTNPDFTTSFNGASNDFNYDDFKVLEFVTYWRDVDNKKEVEYTNKFGKKRLYPYDKSVKKLGEREKIKVMRSRKLYSCTWIVGTNYVYDQGLFPNQPYESNMPWIPLRMVRLESKSLVNRLVPVADQFAQSWFKMVNGFAKASEGGFAIDVTRLALNDPKKFNPLGVVKAWRENNIFFYQSSTNGMNVGGSPVPINLVPGNLRDLVEPYMQHLSWCISFAENLTGIPLIMLGATPKQDAAVGVTEMSLQSANNSLRELLDKMKALKEDVATGTSQMIQLAIKYDDRAEFEYSKVVGKDNISFLKEAMCLPIEYGISMKARPTLMERQSILKAADDALLNGRNGQPGISLDQNIYIKNQVFAGVNLGELQFTLRKWIQKDTVEKQKEKERMVNLQNEGLQKLEQQKGQQAMQIEQMQMKRMQTEYDLKTRSQMLIDNNSKINDIDKIIVETMAKLYGEAGLLRAEAIIASDSNGEPTAPPRQPMMPMPQQAIPQQGMPPDQPPM